MKVSIVIPVYNEVATIEEVIKRVKKVSLDMEREIIIVDDASSDGTRDLLASINDKEIRKIFHDHNLGKGAALRTAFSSLSGDIVIIQDADLEYYPDEYPRLIEPIINKKADVVYGSRFIGAHRCFLFTHFIGNKVVNLIANILYNTNLTDFMSCYKVFTIDAIKNISIKSNRFGFESEITGLVFRKNLRVYEVPISYSGRDYREGKKIKWHDFFPVVGWLLYTRFRPLYRQGCLSDLDTLSYLQKYNDYLFDRVNPYLGRRLLEIGAGIGNFSQLLIKKRKMLVSIDNSKDKLLYLSRRMPDSTVFKSCYCDLEVDPPEALKEFKFDSAVCVNMLEHLVHDKKTVNHIYNILEKGGVFVLVVPAGKRLFSPFDNLLKHYRRYSREDLEAMLQESGFKVKTIEYLNFLGIFLWWLNFKILRRKRFSTWQLFIFNQFVWIIRITDKIFPKAGLSLLAVAEKE
ncbi:MAG: bifunctional glycosyltransferase/class I SAM-dependent methyltransferase [Candidatus Omnitrophota bacterium]